MDLDAYRAGAEAFTAELGTAYYRHYAGHDPDLAIEPVYARHAALFERAAVDRLRARAAGARGDERRRLRALLDFAVEGHMGGATKEVDAELARRERTLELDLGDERVGFRESSVAQANEPDPQRRADLESARLEATARELNPLRREALDAEHARARELGWPGYRARFE